MRRSGKRKLIVNGHYHDAQNIQRKGMVPVHCVGAPLAHSWRDIDTPQRGYSLIEIDSDTDMVTVKRHALTKYPRFLSAGTVARKQDFVAEHASIACTPTVDADDVRVGGAAIGGTSRPQIIGGYVAQRADDMDKQEITKLTRIGMQLMAQIDD